MLLNWIMRLMGQSGLILRAADGGLFASGRVGLNVGLSGLISM